MDERYVLQVYVGSLSRLYEALSIEASKTTSAEEIVECICEKLALADGAGFYELAEVMGNQGGQDCKERRLGHSEYPVALQLLWPKKTTTNGENGSAGGHNSATTDFKFALRRKLMGNLAWSLSMSDSNDSQLIRDYFYRFIYQPRNSEYPDLCQLPDLTDQTLLENLKARFEKGHIYTYVGSILIAVNPFTFFPIYNPKYVQLYQNRRLGDLPPHIFAIADAAYQSMLRKRTNQCIVISGESGSGKTESTNLLLHHLTALSQKGTHGSGVEQTILGAGPVLEAFGNAKTKFNNNSSRFGKFIQVNYKENGAVHGALVQKYLLEKSRIVSQVTNERNYHVFYYLLDGLAPEEKEKLHLTKPQDYFYLNQSKCYTLEGVDERHEFSRLTQSMEMVGFSRAKQSLCFRVLSAVLHLGNVQFSKKSTYHSDETVMISNPEEVAIISQLLTVKEETLTAALTCKRTKAAKGEMLVINYKLPDAIATRDAMAKCLYGALFDWIVMQVNHALLSKKDPREHKGNSIGVLDIFGFEDFGDHNNFEQFCINYANERLQYYFNQHVFKYEQEEYQREGISWRNIDFNDNTECLKLIEDKPDGLLYLLDDQCNFPCGSNETVLQKFIYHHNSNSLFEVPPCRGSAFTIKHYAGKVKYQIRDFREKNLDLMRPDIVSVLKVSQMAFVRELVCADPLALFRWQILKAFFKAYFLFSKLRELSKMKRGLTDAYLIKEFSSTNRRRTLIMNNNANSSGSNNATNSNGSSNQQLSRTMSSDNHRSLHLSTSSSSISSTTLFEKEAEGSGDATPTLHATAETRKSVGSESGGGGGHRITKALLTRQALFSIGGSSFGTSTTPAGGFGGSFFSQQPNQQAFNSPGQCVHGALMRTSSSNFSCPVHGSQAHLCSSEARLLSRANKILMKKKYYNTYHHSGHHGGSGHHLWRRGGGGFEKSIRNFKLLKQLLGPPVPVPSSSSSSSNISNLNHHVLVSTSSASSSLSSSSLNSSSAPPPRPARKQTPTVTHQFQQSLQQLMDTLSHANPFFVRCIKSNAEKMPNHFDDKLVLMQLRYTGMLETVRIRQSGYSVRLTFDEFIQHYRILLPKGLLSSKMDVQQFLLGMKLAPNMYQIGNTKVFMRESEKLVLDERLHEEILRRIINLQRWVRTWLCRKRFSEMRTAAIVIQTYARRYIAQRRLSQLKKIAQYENWAANCIQKHWRCYQARQWFTSLRRSVVNFQAHCRGTLLRARMQEVVEENAKARAEAMEKAKAAEVEAEAEKQRLLQQQLAKKNSVSVSAIRTMPVTTASDSSYRENVVDTTLTPLLTTFSVSGGSSTVKQSSSEVSPLPSPSSATATAAQHAFSPSSTTSTTVSEIPTITATVVTGGSSISADHQPEEAVYCEEDFEDDFENDDYVRLNRKRNIPIRKTSFKRKANKSLSDEKLLLASNNSDPVTTSFTSSSNLLSSFQEGSSSSSSHLQPYHQQFQQQQQQQHRQLTKLSSDSNVLLTTSTTSSASLGFSTSSGYNTNSDSASSFAKLRLYDHQTAAGGDSLGLQQFNRLQHGQLQPRYSVSDESGGSGQPLSSTSSTTGPIQKAKATFRNIMGGKSSATNLSTLNQESNGSKRLLKQSVSVKYGSEGGVEDDFVASAGVDGSYSGKSLSNSDLGVGGTSMSVADDHQYIANSAFYSAYQQQHHLNSSSQYDLLPSYQQHQQQQPTLSHLVVANSGKLPGSSKSRLVSQNLQEGSSYKQQQPQQQPSFTLLSRHTIRKEEHFKSGEICAICENSILSPSSMSSPESHYKCTECRQLFHNKCFHLSSDIPCIKEGTMASAAAATSSTLAHGFGQGQYNNAVSSSSNTTSSFSVLNALNPSRPPRNKQKKLKNFSKSKENQEQVKVGKASTSTSSSSTAPTTSSGKQSVRITQFTDPHDILITDTDELQTMDKFISKKIREMEEGGRKKAKESMVDTVFKSALKDFKANLISTYSVGNYQEGYFRLTYKDLIDHFEQILHNVCQKEKTYTSFPVIMGVNAFRGYMDELRKLHNSRSDLKSSNFKDDKLNGGQGYQGPGGGKSSKSSTKQQQRKQSKKSRNRKKEDEVFTSYEHEFILSMANIYTVCEVCSSYMWLMDKIWVCRRCKLTCHKKCAEKVNHTCRDGIGGKAGASQSKVIFGAPLSKLVSDDCRIPLIVEQLITKIELKGLYTEGIYRKSGTSSKINELKGAYDACGLDSIGHVDLDQYSVHVLAATLKLFFREMPEPLMTYELYDHFLWATTVSDAAERVQIILNHIGKLPKHNYDLLERLTFHLARVAQQESANRMNANSLAIVFAPCVLRTNKMMQMQEKLNDIGKQTKCIETIISERMRQISDTLNDIDILDVACHTASSRLSSIRHSKLNLSRDAIGLMRTTSNSVDDEEALLSQRIDELITEKQHLTTILPTFRLASACSDEDMLSSNENEGDQNQTTMNAGGKAGANASSDECLTAPSYHATSNSIGLPLKVVSSSHPQPTASTTNPSSAMKPRVTLEQKGADYW